MEYFLMGLAMGISVPLGVLASIILVYLIVVLFDRFEAIKWKLFVWWASRKR